MIDLLGRVKYSVILHFVVEFVLLMSRFSCSFFFFLQVLLTSILFLILYLFRNIKLDICFK